MADKVRVGLVGANASGGSWSSVAHIPAMRAVPGLELTAVCTRRPESAEAAAKAFDIGRHFHDVREMVEQPDIDLVAVIVKVPGHLDAVTAALNAGKHVYCEWPLGGDLEQTQAMARLCRERGVVGAVGLQGRHDPHLRFIKSLHEEGWFGDLLSVDMSMVMKAAPAQDRGAPVPGASMFAIAGGHTLDVVTNAFGPVRTVSARVGRSTDAATTPEPMTDGTLDESADHVLLHAALSNGAFLSARVAEVRDHNSGWRMTVHGSDATLEASTSILPQISPITIRGAKTGRELAELNPPGLLDEILPGATAGPPRNIAIAYSKLVAAIGAGTRFRADFEDACVVHDLLWKIQRSSDLRQAVELNPDDSTP